MTTRKYSSRAQQTTLSSSITAVATTMTVGNASNLMATISPTGGETYTVVIDPDTAVEEIVDVTGVSGSILTITRGVDNANTGFAHSAGAIVRHMVIGRDLNEANAHIENTTTAHGVTLANLVKTTDTGTVTSTMITNNTIVDGDINSAAGISDTKLGTISTALKVANSATTATSANTASTIVARDASGNFAATTVTAALIGPSTSTTGNAATATALATPRAISLTGDITATGVNFDGTAAIALTTAYNPGSIVDADINASAAIAYSKLNLGSSIVSADIVDGTILNADVNSSAQIAYSKLNLTNSIVNADINASAAIALSKLATDPLARANHTGTQLAATVSDFDTQVRTSRLDQMAVPTATVSVNSQKITNLDTPTASADAANKGYVDTQITNLIAAAPGALDTLDELAAALGDDANFATTVTNSLATKLPLAGGTMSGAIAMGTSKITGMGDPTSAQDAATKNYIDNVVLAPSNLTGPITSVGAATSIASQTGTGTKFVVDTSPTLITPVLGVATATSINSTPIPSSKTLVATDSTTYVVPSQTGNSGKFLTTDGTTSSWGAVSGFSAPTLGSTVINSGATVTTIAGLTLTAPTLTGTVTASGDITLSASGAFGSIKDFQTLTLMGAL